MRILYKSCIEPILLYGSEVYRVRLRKRHWDRLKSAQLTKPLFGKQFREVLSPKGCTLGVDSQQIPLRFTSGI